MMLELPIEDHMRTGKLVAISYSVGIAIGLFAAILI